MLTVEKNGHYYSFRPVFGDASRFVVTCDGWRVKYISYEELFIKNEQLDIENWFNAQE